LFGRTSEDERIAITDSQYAPRGSVAST